MPATYTHHQFSKDVIKSLDLSISNKINLDIFNLFGKSFDILFFTDMKMGNYAHNHNVNLYFENIISYIKKNHLENDFQVLAYLYGSVCHYILDSVVHPYVFYKTGRYNKHDKSTKKYLGKHTYFEYMIDAIIYQENNQKPIYNVNLKKEVFPKLQFSNSLKSIIDDVFLNTFQYNNGFKHIKKGYHNYKFCVQHFMCSTLGIKKCIYKILDVLPIFRNKKLSYYCYRIKKLDLSVLNLEHNKWCYPVDKNMSYHYSFYDLYDIAILKAHDLIMEIDHALNNDTDLKTIYRHIGNNSYATGKQVGKNFKMKHFEY